MSDRQSDIHAIVSRLQVLFERTQLIEKRAKVHPGATDESASRSALIALGLCASARQQIASTCLNFGFKPASLPHFGKREISDDLLKTIMNASVRVEKCTSVRRELVVDSIQALAMETTAIITLTLAQAEAFVSDAEQAGRAPAA